MCRGVWAAIICDRTGYPDIHEGRNIDRTGFAKFVFMCKPREKNVDFCNVLDNGLFFVLAVRFGGKEGQ